MKNNTTKQLTFSSLKNKKISALFDEPSVTTDFGVMLAREIEREIGIVDCICSKIADTRRQTHLKHVLKDMLSQRVYQIIQGWEDTNDCDTLRSDPAFKIAVGKDPLSDQDLASQPTMCRFENMVTTRDLLKIGYAFIEHFIQSYEEPPSCIIVDMDPTADTVYGNQQLRLFNAYEDEYCFMPFHVYEGLSGKLITTVLRPGKTPTSEEIISILKRIERRLRKAWPQVQIIFRADSHHTKPEVMDWLEQHAWSYITGLSGNNVLDTQVSCTVAHAKMRYRKTGNPVREYASIRYKAGTWSKHRRVICRIHVTDKGVDVRYIVTSFELTSATYLYEKLYCGRGKMELMIKDHKCGLHSDRTSCHTKQANQFRLFLFSAAYVILHAIRDKLLKGTELARAQFDTIRLKLLKLGARVVVKKTRIIFHLPESYPLKHIYYQATALLCAYNTS